MKTPRRTFLKTLSLVFLLLLPVMGSTGEAEGFTFFSIYDGFSIEVLLNRNDIEYDLEPLEDMVDEGLVNKQGGLIDGLFGSESWDITGGDASPFPFFSLYPSYIYRGHVYNETAVVVQETDNGFLSEIIDDEVELSGLSIKLLVPVRYERTISENEEASLVPAGDVFMNSSTISNFKDLGYLHYLNLSLGLTSPNLDQGQIIVSGHKFLKENMTWDFILEGPYEEDGDNKVEELIITGNNISLEGPVESDILGILDNVGINRSIWDDREMSYTTNVVEYPVPDISHDPESIDWGAALRKEIEILMNYSIVQGLTHQDLDSISSIAGLGESSFNDVIFFHEGKWGTIGEEISQELLFLWPASSVTREAIPIGSFAQDPYMNKRKDPNLLTFIIWCGIFLIISGSSLLLYTRLKSTSLLNNANRNRIFSLIEESPGIHFRKLARTLNLKQGVLSYHLNILEKHEMIKSVQDRSQRRFFISGTKVKPSMFLTDLQSSIVDLVMDSPGISKSKISRELGRSRALVGYHVRILNEARLLEIRKDGRMTSCFPVEITPS